MSKRKKIQVLGMNYGHHIVSSSYDSSVTSEDLDFLKEEGFEKIRVAVPTYNASVATTAALVDVVNQAIEKGFIVQWGYCCTEDFNLTTWNAYKSFVSNTFIPLAESLGLDEDDHEILLGNEEELKCDGVTVNTTTVRSDIRSLATSIKAGGYSGKISYSADGGQVSNWISDGKGDLDKIHFNLYDTLTNFGNNCIKLVKKFGTNDVGISEFNSAGLDYLGTEGGYTCYNSEYDHYHDTHRRVKKIEESGIKDAIAFTYKDGGFGLGTDVWAFRTTEGKLRRAFNALTGNVLNRKKLPTYDKCLYLSGTNVARINNSSVNFNATGTYSWIGRFFAYRPGYSVFDTTIGLVSKSSNGVKGYFIIIQYGKIRFQERKTYTTATSSALSNVDLFGRWVDWAVTYDGTNQEIKLYLDGVEQLRPVTETISWSDIVSDTTSNFSFGINSATENILGLISDCAFYDRVLTKTEVENFSKRTIPESPVLHFKMNEGTGTSLTDSSGNGNTGIISSSSMWKTITNSRTSATHSEVSQERTSV